MMFKFESNMGFNKAATRISENTKINGFIETTGVLKINGTLKGGIREASVVVIGNTGIVEGDINSPCVKNSGKVKGNIFSESTLELLPGSVLDGDIETAKLLIAEGAYFYGSCSMPDEKTKEDG